LSCVWLLCYLSVILGKISLYDSELDWENVAIVTLFSYNRIFYF
jgi:hypothetical protein